MSGESLGHIQAPAEPNPPAHWSEQGGRSIYFIYAGLLFLFLAFLLFIVAAYVLYSSAGMRISIGSTSEEVARDFLTDRDMLNFLGDVISFYLGPLITLISAIICTFVGFRLLKAGGAATQYVIPPHDREVIVPAILKGDDVAISQYIRLSSLSGSTGTFTKVGLTGLPLATIVLTVFLAIVGLANEKFFDLAQLTLGAFIGSFVQKRSDLTDTAAKPPSTTIA